MASAFAASAINLNMDLQESLVCAIHRGLLSRPMLLPCKGKHRLCKECMENLTGTQNEISCPECREICQVPSTWANDWFDRALNTVTETLLASENEINKKIEDFVQRSYAAFGRNHQKLHVTSVQIISNTKLKTAFQRCKDTLDTQNVVTLLHGTTRKAALSISAQGFRIPTTFNRYPNSSSEGELKFGKAIYFGEAKKATEYGENTLVLADCILGRVLEKKESELKLTPDVVHRRGYHTIHYYDPDEGPVNQEWAIYKSEQCYPLCIITYEFLDKNDASEQELINNIKKMSKLSPESNIILRGLKGTDNQCKEALRFIGDAGSQGSPHASRLMSSVLQFSSRNELISLFERPNETIRILFLRALWQTGRCNSNVQLTIYRTFDWSLLIKSLCSGYADVSWRACGVITNLAAVVTDVRVKLTSSEILNQMMAILKRAVLFKDKICILTVTNLLANIAASEHQVMKNKRDILDYVNVNLLDDGDEEIQTAGNRLFCNIIGKGVFTSDWKRGGYKETAASPSIE